MRNAMHTGASLRASDSRRLCSAALGYAFSHKHWSRFMEKELHGIPYEVHLIYCSAILQKFSCLFKHRPRHLITGVVPAVVGCYGYDGIGIWQYSKHSGPHSV